MAGNTLNDNGDGPAMQQMDMSELSYSTIFKSVIGRVLNEPINAILLCFVIGFGAYYMATIDPDMRKESAEQIKQRDEAFTKVLERLEEKHVEFSSAQRKDYLEAQKQQTETNARNFELLNDSIKDLKDIIRTLGKAAGLNVDAIMPPAA